MSGSIEAPGQLVRGVLYTISKDEMADLDVLEMVPQGIYKREEFLVLGEDLSWHKANLYRLVTPKGPYTASKSYVDLMIEGAHQHNLDPEYIEGLDALRRSLD